MVRAILIIQARLNFVDSASKFDTAEIHKNAFGDACRRGRARVRAYNEITDELYRRFSSDIQFLSVNVPVIAFSP